MNIYLSGEYPPIYFHKNNSYGYTNNKTLVVVFHLSKCKEIISYNTGKAHKKNKNVVSSVYPSMNITVT